MKYTPYFCVVYIIIAVLTKNTFGQTANWNAPKVQVTNSIPTNVFLTDNGFIFGFRQSGERVIAIKAIEEAKQSPESRPAAQDPEGNWENVVGGIQVSLRLQSSTFTNGEPVRVTMLVRNVTNRVITHYWPHVVISKNGKPLERNGGAGIDITAIPLADVFPQTQHKYVRTLNKDYDLSENGEYTLQAVCKDPAARSKEISILITNAPPKLQ